MATLGQQYLAQLPVVGQDRVLRRDDEAFDPETTQTGIALNKGLGAGYLGLTALQPVVLNNLQYADQFIDTANAFNDYATGVDMFNKLQMAVNLTDKTHSDAYFSETFGLGGLLETGANLGLATLSPTLGMGLVLNSVSKTEDNPFGTIPIISSINEGIDTATNWLDSTQVGRNIKDGLAGVSENTLGRFSRSYPGQIFNNIIDIPLQGVNSVTNFIGEGYEFIDRNLFGGYLPFGATDEDPSSQVWNNPLKPLSDSFENLGELFVTEARADAEYRYNQTFTPIEQKLTDDLVNMGVPYQLAVDSIKNPELLAGYENVWVSDYGRKVAEIEFGQETIDRFKEYAQNPLNNPGITHFDIYKDEAGIKQVDPDFYIDPMMGLLKPVDQTDDNVIALNDQLRDYTGDRQKILGDNFVNNEVVDLYKQIDNADIAGVERFASDTKIPDYTEAYKILAGSEYNISDEYNLFQQAYDPRTDQYDFGLVSDALLEVNEQADNLARDWYNNTRPELIDKYVDDNYKSVGNSEYNKWKSGVMKNNAWFPYKEYLGVNDFNDMIRVYKSKYGNYTADGVHLDSVEPWTLSWAMENRNIRFPDWRLYADPGKSGLGEYFRAYGTGVKDRFEGIAFAYIGNGGVAQRVSDNQIKFYNNAKTNLRTHANNEFPDYNDVNKDAREALFKEGTHIKLANAYSEFVQDDLGIGLTDAKNQGLSLGVFMDEGSLGEWADELATKLSAYYVYKQGVDTGTIEIRNDLNRILFDTSLKNIADDIGGIGDISADDNAFQQWMGATIYNQGISNFGSDFIMSDFVSDYDASQIQWEDVSYNPTDLMAEFNATQFAYTPSVDFYQPAQMYYPTTIDVGSFVSTYNPATDTYSIPDVSSDFGGYYTGIPSLDY